MQKIVPHLWYDTAAKDAAIFYTTLFDQSRLINVTTIGGTPSGDCEIVSFELAGQSFMAISAGPYFKFNPSFPLMVACDSAEEVKEDVKFTSPYTCFDFADVQSHYGSAPTSMVWKMKESLPGFVMKKTVKV